MELDILSIYTFLTFVCIFAGLAVCINCAFATTLAGGMFSSACAVLYFFLNSPDVSMTEASVGVFLSTAIALMTVRITRVDSFEVPSKSKLILSIAVFLCLLFYIYKTSILLGEFGAISFAMEGSGGMQLLGSYRDFQIPNVITTILASYRSFDTMGETVIIFTSAIGIFLIIKMVNSKFTSLN
jgi:multicomponent Na+:H+ antiporter subunit B